MRVERNTSRLSQSNRINYAPSSNGDSIGFVMDVSQMGGRTANQYIIEATNLIDPKDNAWSAGQGTNPAATDTSAGLVISGDTNYASVSQVITCTVGEVYCVQIDALNSGSHVIVSTSAGSYSTNRYDIIWASGPGFSSHIFTATATSHYLHLLNSGSAVDLTYRNVRVVHLPGKHLWAESDAAKATLREGNNSSWYCRLDGAAQRLKNDDWYYLSPEMTQAWALTQRSNTSVGFFSRYSDNFDIISDPGADGFRIAIRNTGATAAYDNYGLHYLLK